MEKNISGSSTTSLVLGLIGIVAWIVPFIGYIVTIIGFILGIIGVKKDGSGRAIAGIVLCVIFFAITVLAHMYTYEMLSRGGLRVRVL